MREFVFKSDIKVNPYKFQDLDSFLHAGGMSGFLRNTDDLQGLSRNMRSCTTLFYFAQKELETGMVTDGRVAEFFLDGDPEGNFGYFGYVNYVKNCWRADAGVVVHPDFLLEVVMSQVRQLSEDLPQTMVVTPYGPMKVPLGLPELEPRFLYQLLNESRKSDVCFVAGCATRNTHQTETSFVAEDSLSAIRILGDHEEWSVLATKVELMAAAFRTQAHLNRYLALVVTVVQKMIENLDNSEFWAKFLWKNKNQDKYYGHLMDLVACKSAASLVRFQLLCPETTKEKTFFLVSGTMSSRREGQFVVPKYFESRTVVDRNALKVAPERQERNQSLLGFRQRVLDYQKNMHLHRQYQAPIDWAPVVDRKGEKTSMMTETEYLDDCFALRMGGITVDEAQKIYLRYKQLYEKTLVEYEEFTADSEAYVARKQAERLKQREATPNFWCRHAGIDTMTNDQIKKFWLVYPVEAWLAGIQDQTETLQEIDRLLPVLGDAMFGDFHSIYDLISGLMNPQALLKLAGYLKKRNEGLWLFRNRGRQDFHKRLHLNSFQNQDPDISFLIFVIWDWLFVDHWNPRRVNFQIAREFVREILRYDPDRMFEGLQKFLQESWIREFNHWDTFKSCRQQRLRDPDALKHKYLSWFDGECRVEASHYGGDFALTEIFFECMSLLSEITDGRLGSDPEADWIQALNSTIVEKFPEGPFVSKDHMIAIRGRHAIRNAVIEGIQTNLKEHPRKRNVWHWSRGHKSPEKKFQSSAQAMNFNRMCRMFDHDAFSGNPQDGFELYIQNRERYTYQRQLFSFQTIDSQLVETIRQICSKMNCTVRTDPISEDTSEPPQFLKDQQLDPKSGNVILPN